MIEFDCPHCGKQLFHQEEFAGRDGWCRYCKGIISIPHAGEAAALPNLTPEQRFAQLERMFKHAASIVDEHRQLQARLQNGGTSLVEELRLRTEAQREVGSLNARVEEAQRMQLAAREECERLNARIAELDQYGTELRQQIESGENDRKLLETDLEEARTAAARIPEIEAAHGETRAALDEQLKENDALLERLLDVEQELQTARDLADKAATAWQAERASYEERLERLRNELCATDDESVELKERMEEAEKAFAETRRELETANAAIAEDRDAVQLRLESAQSELEDAAARNESALIEAKEAERGRELAEKRAAESRAAWDAQKQQLLDEIEALRAAQRAAEEETAAVRKNNREAAADSQAQIEQMKAALANESRLRAAADEAVQRAQRRAADAETELDDAVSRRDTLSRELEAVRSELETERESMMQRNSELVEAKASIEALESRLAETQSERDEAVQRVTQVSGELQSSQQINEQLRTRLVDLEELLETATDPDATPAAGDSLRDEVEALTQKVSELQKALDASQREKSRLEERLVSTENRAAYSELEGVGYRSQFSSMAKQFFEQEVARLSGEQAMDEFTDGDNGEHKPDQAGTAAILDAVSELRR